MVRHLFLALLTIAALAAFSLRANDPPGESQDDARVAEFIKALKSKNADVRKQVALALGELGAKAKAAVPALREALVDADEAVQIAAAKALGLVEGGSDQTEAEKIKAAAAEDIKKLKALLDQERLLAKERETILKETRARVEADRALLAQRQQDLLARTDETRKLNELLRATEAKLADMATKMAQLQTQTVQGKVEAEQLRKRTLALEERLKELEKADRQPEKDKDPAPDKPNPPGTNPNGEVKKVDDITGLVSINIGSDVGLVKGQTLEVVRVKPQAKYVGQIRIIDVTPKEAVARVVGKPVAPVEVGDQVVGKVLINDK